MLNLEAKWQAEARRILAFHLPTCRVFAYGSRVQGTARKFSDLDLAIDAGKAIDTSILQNVRDAFSVSDIPIFVDVIDLQAVDPEFAAQIALHQELFWSGVA